MFAMARDSLGALDVLVNKAGIQYVSPIESFDAPKWDDIIAINLTSGFHTTKYALPGMRARNWGRIINIASVHGLMGSADKSAYVSAKHGLVGLTKVTALETAKTGVTCNAICPGFVLTPLVQKQIHDLPPREGLSPDDARARLLGEKPSGRFVTPKEVGNPSIFSATSSEARGIYGDFTVGALGGSSTTVQSLRRTRVRAPHYMISIWTLWPLVDGMRDSRCNSRKSSPFLRRVRRLADSLCLHRYFPHRLAFKPAYS
ncbi:putative 3-hydroxybutyrate dehydrogenase (plasmid) [Cupriavidus taiwanensis]|uniref:3-hydroxybutyrate dehydrogenase n=1 Tax=Cupriavidus taiwanensis TaxID=164546 RepID=A0A375EH35_9BURK|nr:putative 3-hydroxybutyrate dehydrogenase [Cupriavidus taiwanensis]SOZ72502.1 putative 3-hydroxybutyrate dehydrogenase [Cupriavidus taiwanensis]SOZ74953.1 putative 3-hydroxybutyrate dehydrogenase [Cupriavidus taiwanensis]SPA03366.1 putative 3-hydroxybutyrate dehydrogenase [Cupriavidus taiwanensis]SPA11731.1 putative 3-hydroxybutyrate dehydrogenase [Cupriavidus taiwanensis]